ncbi:uncharacterized protein [Littorina saxatilis]|uniref:C1q domain-containing protein n=1 Tax=Littorina saxatilis TaxID=31220 RepID=A0AAN9AS59_9CAEN
MTTTTATLRMLLLICISLGQIRLVTMQSVKVPVDGVYLITMVADPDGRTDMFLQFNGHDAGFVAYGLGDAVAGLVVAVYLKTGTRVSARYTGNTQGATSLGVAFASYNKTYVTLRCSGQSSGYPNVVKFDHRFLSNSEGWLHNNDNANYMKTTMSGIYWVAARPDCGNRIVGLNVGPGLFNVFCHTDKALSASGAFYLPAGRYLKVTFKYGRYLQGGTSFSFVYLEGNQQKYINHTHHIAFTAWTDRVGGHSRKEKLSFNRAKVTDYGSLYNSAGRTWTIPTTGSYIVSMRGDPDGNTLKVIFYKNNNKYLFAWYNENRTKSGQAGVFQFTKGDRLYMINEFGSYVGKETFMSIALLWIASE